jgi:hypothetical protein
MYHKATYEHNSTRVVGVCDESTVLLPQCTTISEVIDSVTGNLGLEPAAE